MRIGINAIFRFKPTGVANYICNLVYNLSLIDRDNDYFIFINKENHEFFPVTAANFHLIDCDIASVQPVYRRLWEQFVFPRIINRYGLDLLHCPMNVLTMGVSCRKVLTIIDMQYFENPEHFSFMRREYLKFMMRRSCAAADGVITISNEVKKQVNQHFIGTAHDKVNAIHLGMSGAFRVIDEDKVEDVRQRFGIQGRYVLFYGYPHYRKNLLRLTRAFHSILSRLPDDYQFVIAGEMGGEESDYEQVVKTIREHDMEKRVVFTGYVAGSGTPGAYDNLDMSCLLNGAEMMVYPSLYEGFGLPVIEAMACGTPVLTSDLPVMREIIGDNAVLVDPKSTEAIAEGMYRGLTDEGLKKTLREKGLQLAEEFTWRRTAEKTLKLYCSVCGD
ncbi:MAG: glycosyltransferase family 4 protein [Nitrospira sp.]|nr:glycosyltransferase family 4 protein [bacterium]MBL7047991.1 glycosyltransferase family 4 protein [Nitrospira sp.]